MRKKVVSFFILFFEKKRLRSNDKKKKDLNSLQEGGAAVEQGKTYACVVWPHAQHERRLSLVEFRLEIQQISLWKGIALNQVELAVIC